MTKSMLQLVKKALREDDRLSSGGTLLKNKIMELTHKQDEKLIDLLLSNDGIKEHFFTEVNGTLVFDKDEFIKFVNNKQFLPDSYTTFKNKIGLTSDGEYLDKKKDVALAWPYKDCVLEGEQVDPDEDREEVFWNEILAPDEIDRLLDPKVLTDFKKVDEEGEHENLELKSGDSLILKGNNLLALHSLKKKFRNKVKLIYLDPPFNTGNDEFNYNDKFNHSTWLTFMKNRLTVAKEFLSDKGAIVVHCDDNEQAYLKVLMDEVFGRENFVDCVTVKMSELSGQKMAHVEKSLPKLKHYLLIYKRNEFKYNVVTLESEDWDSEYNLFLENFTEQDYRKIENFDPEEDNLEEINEILEEVEIINISEKIEQLDIEENRILSWKKQNSYRIVRSAAADNVLKLAEEKQIYEFDQKLRATLSKRDKLYLLKTDYDRDAKSPRIQIIFAKDSLEKPIGDIWTDISTTGLHTEGGVTLRGKKPERLLKRVIYMTTDPEDLVLDFFLGSGTTAAVAHKMNRRYIGIEQLDYGEHDPAVRLKNVIDGDQTGISEDVGWNGGGSFVYCELLKWNQKYVERIKDSETEEEHLEIWEEMKEEAFLSYKLNPQKFDENVEEFKELDLEDQKNFLMECLDKNHLYVNLSEIDDEEYDISEEDKKMNKQFYGGL